jgi:hypothetical protein
LREYITKRAAIYMRKHPGQTISRMNVCEISSKAYSHALSPKNLTSDFRRVGVFPYTKDVVDRTMLAPNYVFAEIANNTEGDLEIEIVVGNQDVNEINPHVNVEDETNKNIAEEIGHEENTCDIHETNEQGVVENNVTSFFAEKHLTKPTSKLKKKRKYIHPIVSGRTITKDEVVEKNQEIQRGFL